MSPLIERHLYLTATIRDGLENKESASNKLHIYLTEILALFDLYKHIIVSNHQKNFNFFAFTNNDSVTAITAKFSIFCLYQTLFLHVALNL